MARTALLALAGVVAMIGAAKPECELQNNKVLELTKQVEELRAKFDTLGGATTRFSVLGAATTAKTAVGNAFQSALDSTDIDDKLTERAAAHYETARAFTVDAMGKVSALDHKEHVNKLKQHAVYKEHVAPLTKKADELMAQHVHPVLEAHVYPAMDKARAAMTQATNTVLPVAREHKDKVFDHLATIPSLCNQVEIKVGDFLAPVFAAFVKVSPDHESVMPAGGVDRVLFLVVLLVAAYYFLFLFKFAVGVTFSVTKKTTSLALKLAVVLPLSIISKVLGTIACFATCFYCCGLCRRKSSSKESKKGDKSATKNEQKEAGKVTCKELVQLLEASKKKGKLDEAVKLLSSKIKDGKPLEGKSFPENVKGKILDKATLKTACGNFKEIDVKKL